MLVYGDARRRESPAAKLDRIRDDLAAAGTASGIVRHGFLVSALIEAGELAQGLLDAAFAARGERDGRDPAGETAIALATALARLVVRSWRDGFETEPDPAAALALASALDGSVAPAEIDVRLPEGFAYYAVYPEAFMEAADTLPQDGAIAVVGIRSIGTTLAAAVAAALDAPAPFTLRPVGHPFRREIAVDDALRAALRDTERGRVAVVDEGPGLSGSSIAAVVRHLSTADAEPGRVILMPSHAGPPGPEADATVRAVWARHPRRVRDFDDVVLRSARRDHRLEHWVADLVGDPIAPLDDVSAGGWRAHRYTSEADWAPVHPWQERRKFLCETAGGPWLLRFAGLGRVGRARLVRAEALSEAGFVPEVSGFRHGFTVERWLRASGEPLDRSAVLDRIGAYLGFRARAFPAESDGGASLDDLFAMALHNAAEALGPEAAAGFHTLAPAIAQRRSQVRRVETDNRLQRWEWLQVGPTLLKTDALDHHAGHDLVGCQDIAWDIAGTSVEFDLSAEEVGSLVAAVERAGGHPVSPELARLYRPLYLAFQLGYYTMAAAAAGAAERDRLRLEVARYRSRLHATAASR